MLRYVISSPVQSAEAVSNSQFESTGKSNDDGLFLCAMMAGFCLTVWLDICKVSHSCIVIVASLFIKIHSLTDTSLDLF